MSDIHQKLAEEIVRQATGSAGEAPMLFPTIVNMICRRIFRKRCGISP